MTILFSSPKKMFSTLFVVTFALILHVHTQTAIFRVSYSIQKKEKEMAVLSDEFKLKNFEVSKLHSLNYLDKRMKEMKLNLVMPKEVKVVSIPQVPQSRITEAPILQKGIFSFVSLIKEAQAKTSAASSSR